MIINMFGTIGRYVRESLITVGAMTRLLAMLVMRVGFIFRRPRLLIEQLHFIGNFSLLIIIVSGVFVGFVLALQGYYILSRYGSSEALGMMVALSLLRELGPVLSALLFAGRAGTSLTAEIGLMKAGEQLSAIEVMAIDPIKRILVPRFYAGLIALPLLAAVFSAVGILGGWFVGVHMIGIDDGAFWSQMQSGVDLKLDVFNGIVKSVVFAVIVTLVAVFEGFRSHPSPEGVARATTRTVVTSSLAVLGADFILTALMFSF